MFKEEIQALTISEGQRSLEPLYLKPCGGNDHFGFFHTGLIIRSSAGYVQRHSVSNCTVNAITSLDLFVSFINKGANVNTFPSGRECPAEANPLRAPLPFPLVHGHLL